jgi:hypothetical protein
MNSPPSRHARRDRSSTATSARALYALREATAVAGGVTDVHAMLGVLSLIFWSLLIVISLKYIVFILRLDNDGEGGVLSLVALVEDKLAGNGKAAQRLVLLAVLGTAFFYCDALITPAISVLGAVEGLSIMDADMQRFVVPGTLGILVALFAIQRRGTEKIGRLFGPIMVLWFVSIGLLGLRAIIHTPEILTALNRSMRCACCSATRRFAHDPRRRVPRADGRRGALHRHGPLREKARARRLVPRRLARAAAQLLRARRAPALRADDRNQPVLCARDTRRVAVPDHPRNRGRRHRLAGDDLRRVLGHAPGRAARPPAPGENSSNIRRRAWADLRARDEHVHVLRDLLVRADLPGLERTVRRLRRRRERHHGDHDAARRDRGACRVEVAAVARLARVRPVRPGRFRIHPRQRDQDPERRLDPAGAVGGHVRDVRHLARRPGAAARGTAEACGAARRTSDATQGRDPRAGHGSFPRKPPGLRADRAPAEHRPQPRLPREHRDPPPGNPALASPGPRLAQLPGGSVPGIHLVHARFGFMETPDVTIALAGAARKGLRIDPNATFFLGWHLVRARTRHGLAGIKMRLFAYMQRRSAQAAEFFRMPTKRVVVLATEVEI